MYDEMTIADLLVVAHQEAYPEDQPSAEHAPLINELVRRLRRLDVWRSNVSTEINLYLTDDDGSDLLPEPKRIRNMLERLSSAQAAPVSEGKGPTDDKLALIYHDCCGGCEFMDQGGFENAARAVLARYGHQPAPPAAGADCPACEGVPKPGNQPCAACGRSASSAGGEVAELAWWLRSLEDASVWFETGSPEALKLTRAADLLEQRHPTPVPEASGVYYEFVVSDADSCTQAGGIAPTYAQALSEGQHYLDQYQQDGPHTLELRRVEVLHPDALPEQRYPAPVPVAERLPGDELCWWFEPDEDCGYGSNWTLLRIRGSATGYTHWLPATALPLPAGESQP